MKKDESRWGINEERLRKMGEEGINNKREEDRGPKIKRDLER